MINGMPKYPILVLLSLNLIPIQTLINLEVFIYISFSLFCYFTDLKTIQGSLYWTAPEILGEEAPFSEPSDVYSFGIILWELARLFYF